MVLFNASLRQDIEVPANMEVLGARTLAGGPLYTAHEVRTVLDSFKPSVLLWTENCNKDVHFELGWTLDQVEALVRDAVVGGRFIASEWCEQKPDGPCAACDSYEVIRTIGSPKKVYVKFAISKPGMTILVISCHKSRPK